MDWQTLRNQFMRDIGGDPPGAALEDELIAAYTDHPQAIERSVEKITLGFKAGKIRSPWGALKTEVAKATDNARNPTHDRGATKTKAVARAEQWIRTAGIHYDRWTEVADDLFGERGRIREHHTPQLEQRLMGLWQDHRPDAEHTEREQEAMLARWGAQWREQHAKRPAA